MKVLAGVVGIVVLGVAVAGVFISYANKAVGMEEVISRFHQGSQNTLSSYTLKIKEAAKVPDMYVDSLKEVVQATFEGRYGAEGSRATFQWIQEQNLQVDSSLFANLQTIISSGRDEFKLSQDRKIDACTSYQRMLRQPVSGFFMSTLGYPKVDLGMCRIVLDANTNEAFSTGLAEPISF